MANFCTRCGKPLVDGQPCDCCQKDEVVTASFFKTVLDIIKHPVEGFLESVEDETSKSGLILMGAEALLSGLFLFVVINKIISVTMSGISAFTNAGSSVSSQAPSAGGFLIYGILISAISSLVISGLVLGLMKAMAKAEINWFQSCQITGLKSLGASMGFILGILGIVLGLYQFSLIAIVIGSVLGYIYFIAGMVSYPDTNRDVVPYVILIVVVVSTIVAYFVLKEFVLSSLMNSSSSLRSLQNIL